jgi:hypothetical protein
MKINDNSSLQLYLGLSAFRTQVEGELGHFIQRAFLP